MILGQRQIMRAAEDNHGLSEVGQFYHNRTQGSVCIGEGGTRFDISNVREPYIRMPVIELVKLSADHVRTIEQVPSAACSPFFPATDQDQVRLQQIREIFFINFN